MPPRASLTSSFSVADVNNEVVCPLRNQDGSSCRKRCLGVSLSPSRYRVLPLCHYRVLPEEAVEDLALTMACNTGEALPLNAGAHPPCASGVLHCEATGHQGKLRVDDHISSPRTPSAGSAVEQQQCAWQHPWSTADVASHTASALHLRPVRSVTRFSPW